MTKKAKEYILVTEYFHPDTASTGLLMTDLAVGLKERGLELTVYTGQPNYHSGDNDKQPRVSDHQDVIVKRIRAPQIRQTSLRRRLFNWGVFTVWMFFALLCNRTETDREVIFVSNPPFLPIAMWLVCRIRGWEYTYIVHDLYPDQPVELGYLAEGGVIDRVWDFLNTRAYHGAKHVVALGPVMKDRIARNAGSSFNESKVKVIHNWADESFIQPIEKEENWFSQEHNLLEKFTILYSGNIGEFHDLETLINAATHFEEDAVCFLIIGEGDNKDTIVELAEGRDVKGDTVRFLPYQVKEDLPYSLTAGDVSVVTVREGFEGVNVSSKLYSAMAAGMPILAIAQSYDDEARIVTEAQAGIQVPQGDVEGVVEAIETFREHPELVQEQGSNARKAFKENFTQDIAIDRYYRVLT